MTLLSTEVNLYASNVFCVSRRECDFGGALTEEDTLLQLGYNSSFYVKFKTGVKSSGIIRDRVGQERLRLAYKNEASDFRR